MRAKLVFFFGTPKAPALTLRPLNRSSNRHGRSSPKPRARSSNATSGQEETCMKLGAKVFG
eukprot:568876-Amphidinium_carterae.1